jgi:molybdopterin converting factor small subunit
VTLALTVLYFATFTPTIEGIQHRVAGLTERILVLELQAWYVAMGWLVFRRRGQRRPPELKAAVA